MAGTALAAIGIKAAPSVQRGVVGGAERVETALGTAPKAAEAPRVEPALAGKPRVSYADFQAQLEARKAGGEAPVLPPAPQVKTPTMPAPTLTEPFPEVSYAPKGMVNLPEQEARKQILSRIGLQQARQSSIDGDGFAAANEYVTSGVEAPVGQLYRDTLAKERTTLENFGQEIVRQTLAQLSDCDMIYVSFDVDSMDPELTSYGTGTPVENGITIQEAQELLRGFAASDKIAAIEFVEVNPCLDEKVNRMAEIAFDLVDDVVKILSR
jgi:hypothetical protein